MVTIKSFDRIRASTTKTVTIFVVNQLVFKFLLKIEINQFDNLWMQSTIATIAGFMVHDLFTYRLNDVIIGKLNLKSDMSKRILADILYFGTMLVSKELILSYIQNRELSLHKFKNMVLAISGFILYNLIFSNSASKLTSQVKSSNSNIGFNSIVYTITDTSKTAVAILLSDFITDYKIELSTLPTVFSLLIAIPIYHKLTGPLVGVL